MKQYTEADMVSFGKYLLSAKRKKSYAPGPTKKERLRSVNDVDIENWKVKGLHLHKLNFIKGS